MWNQNKSYQSKNRKCSVCEPGYNLYIYIARNWQSQGIHHLHWYSYTARILNILQLFHKGSYKYSKKCKIQKFKNSIFRTNFLSTYLLS